VENILEPFFENWVLKIKRSTHYLQ